MRPLLGKSTTNYSCLHPYRLRQQEKTHACASGRTHAAWLHFKFIIPISTPSFHAIWQSYFIYIPWFTYSLTFLAFTFSSLSSNPNVTSLLLPSQLTVRLSIDWKDGNQKKPPVLHTTSPHPGACAPASFLPASFHVSTLLPPKANRSTCALEPIPPHPLQDFTAALLPSLPYFISFCSLLDLFLQPMNMPLLFST